MGPDESTKGAFARVKEYMKDEAGLLLRDRVRLIKWESQMSTPFLFLPASI